MRITFDRAKREQTLREREIDFRDARRVFAGRTLDVEDRRHDYGETRMQTIGYLAGRMMMVVWTPRGKATRRIISMRKCNAKEQRRYLQQFKEA
jgi:uncharacterized DUF497 family protein